MNWLHTWAGVVLGGVLFAIFWMGTLSVFDREIDRWMMPETRLALAEPRSIDKVAEELSPLTAGALNWYVIFPTERAPVLRFGYRMPGRQFVTRDANPATSEVLPETGSLGGTRFIYPFHYSLHLRAFSIGYWIVGLAAVAMLALCVSGVVIHRKIFTDFFTFRPDKQPRRLVLDLHNVTGVLGLPFHFVITLSGLIIFFAIYFPASIEVAFPDGRRAFNAETYGNYSRPKANRPAESAASLDALVRDAENLWGGGKINFLRVWHPGDANSYVEVRRSYEDDVVMNLDVVHFDARTGERLSTFSSPPAMTVARFISGLHFVQFRHWTLRWIYFGLGLTGCVLIATGYLFWLESRRKKHQQLGLQGVRVVEGVTIGSVTGIVMATLAFLAANRLLAPGASAFGQDRPSLEVWAFFLTWIATFGHAWLRPGRAWREQCAAVSVLAVSSVLLNWATTGDHLVRSLGQPRLHPVAGMDIVLLLGAAVAAFAAYRLGRRERVPARRHVPNAI